MTEGRGSQSLLTAASKMLKTKVLQGLKIKGLSGHEITEAFDWVHGHVPFLITGSAQKGSNGKKEGRPLATAALEQRQVERRVWTGFFCEYYHTCQIGSAE